MEVKDRLSTTLQQRKVAPYDKSSQRSPPKLARCQTLLFFHDDIRANEIADQEIQRI